MLRYLLTLPNLLTLSRPLGASVCIFWYSRVPESTTLWGRWGVLGLLGLLVSSDVLDGWLARRFGQASHIGRILDHVCDVLCILSLLGFFVSRGLVPWWYPAAIVWAFGLYVVDSWQRTTRHARRSFLGSRLGHLGGLLNYGAVVLISVHWCSQGELLTLPVVYGLSLALTVLAGISGSERLLYFLDALLCPRLSQPPQRLRQKTETNEAVHQHEREVSY